MARPQARARKAAGRSCPESLHYLTGKLSLRSSARLCPRNWFGAGAVQSETFPEIDRNDGPASLVKVGRIHDVSVGRRGGLHGRGRVAPPPARRLRFLGRIVGWLVRG
ncbi:MAG: hypothetical protein ACK56I_30670, partial [bacterium]